MLNPNADQRDEVLQAILANLSDGVGNGDCRKILTSWYSQIRKNRDIKPYLRKLGEATGVLEGYETPVRIGSRQRTQSTCHKPCGLGLTTTRWRTDRRDGLKAVRPTSMTSITIWLII